MIVGSTVVGGRTEQAAAAGTGSSASAADDVVVASPVVAVVVVVGLEDAELGEAGLVNAALAGVVVSAGSTGDPAAASRSGMLETGHSACKMPVLEQAVDATAAAPAVCMDIGPGGYYQLGVSGCGEEPAAVRGQAGRRQPAAV